MVNPKVDWPIVAICNVHVFLISSNDVLKAKKNLKMMNFQVDLQLQVLEEKFTKTIELCA